MRQHLTTTYISDVSLRSSDYSAPSPAVDYAYDDFGRLGAVTASVGAVSFSAAYSRIPASGLLEATSFSIQNSTFGVLTSPTATSSPPSPTSGTHPRSPPSSTPTTPLTGARCGSMMGH